jgi:hypothetical protein
MSQLQSAQSIQAALEPLVAQAERVLRRLAFIDMRLAQLEADCEQFAANAGAADNTPQELRDLLHRVLEQQEALQQCQTESLARVAAQLEYLREWLPASLERRSEEQNIPEAHRTAHHAEHRVETSLSLWESTKRQTLQDLEDSDGCGDTAKDGSADAAAGTHPPTAHDWESILQEKEQEIAALRAQLQEWNEQRRILDTDELIRQERARLVELQQMWETKLREAEVEISIERAKLARERLELEEQLRSLKSSEQSASAGSSGNTLRRSRWLKQLGLSDS